MSHRVKDRKTGQGRNDLCPCSSGLKYKKCHGKPVKREIIEPIYSPEQQVQPVQTRPEIVIPPGMTVEEFTGMMLLGMMNRRALGMRLRRMTANEA